MIRINLLPIRQLKKKQRVQNEALAFIASLFVLMAVIGLVALGISSKIGGLQTDITALQQKRASYEPILKKIDKLKKDKEILEAKVQTIKKLKQASTVPVRVLDEVANRTPTDRMWLKTFQQSGSSLRVDGVALDNEVVAQFMTDMNNSPYFANADLVSASQTVVAKTKLKAFTLNFQITLPDQGAQKPEQKAD
jgi:type IV pilus assembly protein PilN